MSFPCTTSVSLGSCGPPTWSHVEEPSFRPIVRLAATVVVRFAASRVIAPQPAAWSVAASVAGVAAPAREWP